MKRRTATCCSLIRCVFAALTLIVSQSVSHAQSGALTFSENAQQYVAVPDFDTLGFTTEVTVEFWARFTTTMPDQTAFGLEPDVPGNRFLAHLWGLGERIYWDFGDIDNDGRVSFANSGGPTAGWTHYAFVASQSGNFMKIYIDGAEVASLASFNAFEITGASALRIGSGSGDYFDGSIDDFRVWNVVRTPAEIAAARTGALVGDEPGLRLYFKFDEPSGNIAVNSATATLGAYNGTLINGAARIRIHTVTSTADSGPGTLRQAVLDAASDDTIFFDSTVFATAQTITLTSGEITLNKSLTIDGSARSSQVTISGGNASRIFYVNSGQTVALKGLTLTDGNGTGAGINPAGGAIFAVGPLMLTQCILSGNSATLGGAIYTGLSPLTLTQCILSGNSVDGVGGAIYANGPATLTHCTLSGNSGMMAATEGGAIFSLRTLTLTHCTLSGNSAHAGGAIFGASSTLTHCTLSGNSATSNGAFGGFGGAIYNDGTLTLTQCTLSGNSADISGGAIFNEGTLTQTHCTLSGNSASSTGGAIWNTAGPLLLTNSVVAGNTAPSAADIYNTDILTRVGANIVQSLINEGPVNGSGTISNAAPQLAALGNYGGPTQTMPPLAGSPAIDGVPAGSEVAGLITDQRGTGFPRVVDGDGNGSALADIGAVEAQTTLIVTHNRDDGSYGSLRYAVFGAAAGATITFAPGLSGDTINLVAAKGEIVLSRSVIIDASDLSGGVTIHGGPGPNRIFTVSSGQTVALQGLTLAGGNSIGATNPGLGGAIYNSGTLVLTQCTLSGNFANTNGGAIFSDATLTLTQCTLSGNSTLYGGAIGNGGTLVLTQCTISRNSASVYGGAIYNFAPLTLTNSIVGSNNAPDGADIFNTSTVTRVGANIVKVLFNDGGTVNGAGTISFTSPQLSPLGHYGGATQTMPPRLGSPAIDGVPAGSEVAGLTTDQRGFPRLTGAQVDIGAVEIALIVTNNLDDGSIGSLRQVVQGAPDGATVIFAPGLDGSTITLDAAKGEIVLRHSVIIDASDLSGGVTIDGGPGSNRIFFVSSGQTVALEGLTLTGGGGVGMNSNNSGGAIYNHSGTLTLTRCTLFGNFADIYGGAIYSNGPLTLTQCTLSRNSTALGGAIWAGSTQPLTLTQCTVSRNFAAQGGAIYNGQLTLTLINSIISGNRYGPGAGADILNMGALVPVGANIVASIFNEGGFVYDPGTISTADPLLAPLGHYGGPTQTMALLPTSPARDAAAVLSPALTGDQRGFPIVGPPDIGAYEAGTFTNYNAWIWESLPTAGDRTINDPLHAASFDYDSDGVTNGIEWIARTNPGDPASYLHITQTTHTGNAGSGTLSVTFPSVLGREYTVEASADLIVWVSISAPTAGTGNPLTLTVSYESFPTLFVRVRVGP